MSEKIKLKRINITVLPLNLSNYIVNNLVRSTVGSSIISHIWEKSVTAFHTFNVQGCESAFIFCGSGSGSSCFFSMRIRFQLFSQCGSGSSLKFVVLNIRPYEELAVVEKQQKKNMELVQIYFKFSNKIIPYLIITNFPAFFSVCFLQYSLLDTEGKTNADPDPQSWLLLLWYYGCWCWNLKPTITTSWVDAK